MVGRLATGVAGVDLLDDDGDPVETVRASFADFVWALPAEQDPLYPVLGISTTKIEGSDLRKIVHVAEESVAERAGFLLGDIVLSMDGTEIPGGEWFNRRMASLRWGDSASFTLRRGEQTVTVDAHFRRTAPDPCETD